MFLVCTPARVHALSSREGGDEAGRIHTGSHLAEVGKFTTPIKKNKKASESFHQKCGVRKTGRVSERNMIIQ